MASGASVGSSFSGFGRGLANALLMNRERQDRKSAEERARADRAFQYKLPILTKLGEDTGDWTPLEQEFAQMFPEQAKSWKKTGSPFTQMAPALLGSGSQQAPADRTSMEQEQDSAILAGNPAATPTLPNRAQPGQGALQPARKTLFGVELPTDEERAARPVNMQAAQMNVRRKYYQQLVDQGVPQAEAWAMAQLPEMSASQQQSGDFTLSEGQVRHDAQGNVIARGPGKPPTTGTTSDFDEGLARYMASTGRPGQPPTTQDETAYLKLRADAQRAPAAGGADTEGVSALARMVARTPALLQGATLGPPGQKGAITAAIAKDPVLKAQFEAARMEPIRTQATTMLSALDQLLAVSGAVIDPATGKATPGTGTATGLSQGAQNLFGEWAPVWARDYRPSAESTDANASLQQIIGQQIIDLLGEMKQQSSTGATGFGQLNTRELDTIMAAATQLKGRLSEKAAFTQLKTLRDKFALVLLPSREEAAPSAGGPGATGANSAPVNITLDTPIYIGPDGRPSLTPR